MCAVRIGIRVQEFQTFNDIIGRNVRYQAAVHRGLFISVGMVSGSKVRLRAQGLPGL